jgi:hypothetical protein
MNNGSSVTVLTANLAGAGKGAARQLLKLQRQLAPILQQQSIVDMLPAKDFFSRINAQAVSGPPDTPAQTGAAAQPGAPSITQPATPSAPTAASEAQAELRVFRREIPVITPQHPASVPKWAVGLAVDHTMGPFTDTTGRTYWFDFYRIVRSISVVRGGDTFLQIPVRGFLNTSGVYNLAAGSIWIRSQLLASTAPAGTYTGLRIKSGQLRCNGPVTISGSNILINPTELCLLSVDLDQQPDHPANNTSTGEDAKNMSITLPASAHFTFRPAAATIDTGKGMKLDVYGSAYTYHKSGATPAPYYASILKSILVPYTANTTDCALASVKSNVFFPTGKSSIAASAWALPVAAASPTQLGVAAGTGAIAMELNTGITATWLGFDKGTIKLNSTWLLAEPGHIALTALLADGNRSDQTFKLWTANTPTRPLRSLVTLSFPKQFLHFYHCFSNGTEAVFGAGIPMTAAIDRPLQADNERLKIAPPDSELMLIKNHANTLVYIQSRNIRQQPYPAGHSADFLPISFALENAFINTTPIEDFFLMGQLTPTSVNIDKGLLLLHFPIHFLLPSLPDPYVTNYMPVIRQSFRTNLAVGPAVGIATDAASRLGMVDILTWPDPASLKFEIVFVAENTDSPVVLLPQQAHQDIAPSTTFAAASINIQESGSYLARQVESIAPQVLLLDVSTNASLFGVGITVSQSDSRTVANTPASAFPFFVEDMSLTTYAFNTRLCTLPQVQWEPLSTIQNPNVSPYPFPSPVTSNGTGPPTLIASDSAALVAIAPIPVIDRYLADYNDATASSPMVSIFSLPFGMEALAFFNNPNDATQAGVQLSLNAPLFNNYTGGIQIKVLATGPNIGAQYESPGFTGATIQLRNLVDLLSGSVPVDADGNPLSVLGPAVDTIFNKEFNPSTGANPRVPVERLDISGYGATIFSNWLNPNAEIAATSQVHLEVMIGRTAHEIVQVKSLLYPWGVPVVRTITIERTSGGGVTRYDSGWKAQGAGQYDFSYVDSSLLRHNNPFEFHPGVVQGVTNVTAIKDTGHTYNGRIPIDNVIMQEVLFNADVRIEDVVNGGTATGLVPSKGQRGYVQLSPYQTPLTPTQFADLLEDEGNLGGPVDCIVNVGNSGQFMLLSRVAVYDAPGVSSPVFVTQGSGSLHLPKEGAWGVVRRKDNSKDIDVVDDTSGIPLIRQGQLGTTSTHPYRFADPTDIFSALAPVSDYGLLHTTPGQKVLYVRPEISRNVAHISSSLQPYFADAYTLLPSKSIFPNLDDVFQLGAGGTQLQITGDGKLKLLTNATLTVPTGVTRDLFHSGNSRIYVDYSDGAGTPTNVSSTFDSDEATPWAVSMQKHTIAMDLETFTRVITITSSYNSVAGGRPQMSTPVVGFGPVLQPIVDILSFLGGFDMAQAMAVTMGNKTDSWEPKFKASLLGLKLKFQPTHTEVYVFGKKVSDVGTDSVTPPLKIEIEIGLGVQYNMLPFSFTSDDPSVDLVAERDMMLSVGGFIKFEGEIDILVLTIGAVGLYAFGMVELELGLDSVAGKSIEFKFAVGVQLATSWPVVGDVSVQLGIGMDFEWKDTGQGMYGLILFKGEAELLQGLIDITISIEAKGGQETDTAVMPHESFCVCEVEFAMEISLCFFINFEFDVTWQEKRQIS